MVILTRGPHLGQARSRSPALDCGRVMFPRLIAFEARQIRSKAMYLFAIDMGEENSYAPTAPRGVSRKRSLKK
jgi:hypothetical protein